MAKPLKLDNEVSATLTNSIKQNNPKPQPASPDDHGQLPAEQAIQDVKAHFISIQSITDQAFPGDGWDQLIQHIKHTLNMLRLPRMNPLISAHTTTQGHFNCVKTPTGPHGCKAPVVMV